MDIAALWQVWEDPSTADIIALTCRVAASTLLLHLSFGVPIAWVLARRGWPGRLLLDAMVTLPLIMPPMATGFLLLLLLGRRGPWGHWLHAWFGWDLVFSASGLILASFLAGLPLVVKPIQSALEDANSRWSEAARTLGKSEWVILLRILLPNIRGAILAGLLLGLGRALGEVGVTLMLGGNIAGRTVTASLEIYNAVLAADQARATLFALLLGVLTGVLFLILHALHHRCAPRARP